MNSKSICLMFCAIFSLALFSCSDSPSEPETKPFVIENLGVRFGPWNKSTNEAGDFLFKPYQRKVFLEFGAEVGAGGGAVKALPTFEYRLKKDVYVTAIAEGEVVRFVYQDNTQDYEFSVRSRNNPAFNVGYDHVKNPTIKMGDSVAAGDTLGSPGTWSDDLGRFEIMVNNYETGLSYCPFCFFNTETVDYYQQQVLQFMKDWEEFEGDTTLYDEKNHVSPGCRMESMESY